MSRWLACRSSRGLTSGLSSRLSRWLACGPSCGLSSRVARGLPTGCTAGCLARSRHIRIRTVGATGPPGPRIVSIQLCTLVRSRAGVHTALARVVGYLCAVGHGLALPALVAGFRVIRVRARLTGQTCHAQRVSLGGEVALLASHAVASVEAEPFPYGITLGTIRAVRVCRLGGSVPADRAATCVTGQAAISRVGEVGSARESARQRRRLAHRPSPGPSSAWRIGIWVVQIVSGPD